MSDNNDAPQLDLAEVTQVTPEELSDEQKTFLQSNADNLTDEQKETYKDVITKKEEEEIIDPEKITPETRTKEEIAEDKAKKEKEEEEEEIDPNDEETISKIVDKKITPLKQENQALKDEMELNAFVQSKPEYTKYKPVILKYMQHPAYKQVPVYNIAAIVASKDLEKLGAEKEREAQRKAAETKSPGTTVRKPGGGQINWHNADKADFEAQKAKVLGRVGN